MNQDRKPRRPVKTTYTVFNIVEALLELQGARLTELAEHLDMAKSAVHNHLATLEQEEFVVKDGDEYRVGLKFLDYGTQVRDRINVYQTAKPELKDLANSTEEVAWLFIEEHGRGIYLLNFEGRRAVTTSGYPGKRAHLHYLAGGKTILAHLPEHRVEEIIDRHGLPARTEETITTREELYEEIETIREQGFAFNDEEEVAHVRAVGAPILLGGTIIGAISVAGPVNRLRSDRFRQTLPEEVMATAETISLRLSHPD